MAVDEEKYIIMKNFCSLKLFFSSWCLSTWKGGKGTNLACGRPWFKSLASYISTIGPLLSIEPGVVLEYGQDRYHSSA